MSKPGLSVAIQDYLKEIYKLQASGERPTTTAIARRMGVAPSSATSMLKKLAALGLVDVHAEADRLEHVLSEELEARIDEQLGYPTHDPHGDPIPDAGLNVDRTSLRSLDALAPGEQATVRRVPDGDAGLLRYLAELTLVPGRRVTMRRLEPFGGPLTVDVGGNEHAISRELAGQIGVSG